MEQRYMWMGRDYAAALEAEYLKAVSAAEVAILRREKLRRKLDRIMDLSGHLWDEVLPQSHLPEEPAGSQDTGMAQQPAQSPELRDYGPSAQSNRLTFGSAILEHLAKSPAGYLSYVALRARLREGPLAERLSRSEKGFYSAILNLSREGRIIREGDHAILPDRLDAFRSNRTGTNSVRTRDVDPGGTDQRAAPNLGSMSPSADRVIRFQHRTEAG